MGQFDDDMDCGFIAPSENKEAAAARARFSAVDARAKAALEADARARRASDDRAMFHKSQVEAQAPREPYVASGSFPNMVRAASYRRVKNMDWGVLTDEERITWVLGAIEEELRAATTKHGPMHSAHEGYAVILEELDEVWDEVKANNTLLARAEMVQVGAMAARFLLDIR